MARTLKDLPHELMVEIFLRMPAKSIGRCRCLSRTWRYHLSRSQFINLHFARKNHQEYLIFTHSKTLYTITPPFENNNVVSKKLELDDTFTQVLGSCNGLVLLTNNKMKLCLVNPLTKQKVIIPKFPLPFTKYVCHGLGYDSVSDDYKIVAIPYRFSKFVAVYSVRRGVWRRVTNSYDVVYAGWNGAFVNGAFHCLSKNGDNETIIAAFDLANKVFYEIPIPDSIDGRFYELCVFWERLCLVDISCSDSNRSDVWTMEEYGSVKSWTKLCSIDETGENEEIVKPLCFVGDNEIVFLANYCQSWIVYNVKEGTVKKLVVDGLPDEFMSGDICFDSLISLPQQVCLE